MNNVNIVKDLLKLRYNKETEFTLRILLDQHMQYQ